MRRFYLLWLFLVTLSAIFVAGLQSSLERSRLSSEADAHASDLLTPIEDSVNGAYHARRFSQIAKTMNRLPARPGEDIAGLAICSESPDEIPRAFPNGSGWQAVCGNPHVREVFNEK